jgi:hypothetical protein
MYFNGQGTSQSDIAAYAWVSMAAAQGKEVAAEQRQEITSRMTNTQITSAEELFNELYQEILL